MGNTAHTTADLAIQKTVEQFNQWRRTKKHREPIPPDLWKAAAKLSHDYSTTYIAKVLRLNYGDLKAHIEKLRSNQTKKTGMAPRFREITPGPDGAVSCRHQASTQCVVEMVNRFGDQMRIHISRGARMDLPQLTRSFLGGHK
jgi:hypothetical protein